MAIRPYNRINVVIFYCGVREAGICLPFRFYRLLLFHLPATAPARRYLSGIEGEAEGGERDGP